MRLASLALRDFRNLAEVEIRPSPRATVLVGDNGQGKTNLLEAIHLLATLKPIRAARLADLVRLGAGSAEVAGDFEGPGGIRRVAVRLESGVRTAFLDGKPQERLDAYFEGLAAVCFSPDDLSLVKAGPEGRRRFLDRAAFNRWPAVLGEAREYVRALRARNAALRSAAPEVEESFRTPLALAAAHLLVRRRELVRELGPHVRAACGRIFGPGAPEAGLGYRAAAGMSVEGSPAEIAARLSGILAQRARRDRERGYTSAGPHVDDLLLTLDGRGARTFGSQGQQRALVLALKIAEIENLRAALGRPPLLLLDDVSSELDPTKNRLLLDYLAALPGQAFLTTTDRRLLEPAAGPETLFLAVENGAVIQLVS
ncbi:MAG TPA: DNA replication/repair protein RecF [Anaeromyxobacteraceae bacterium]|nr:DNA replication/repair protein RecF [Anaeromyxobacteraceae bacterium]